MRTYKNISYESLRYAIPVCENDYITNYIITHIEMRLRSMRLLY